ncbi:hypothetical protein L1887_11215 [Cichorium endivia]|nr:hypothetical protein L1887_11215 [Cichorium endivia]
MVFVPFQQGFFANVFLVGFRKRFQCLSVCIGDKDSHTMVNRVYGRRSERQRKKALRRFSNLQNDPLVIEDDVQDPEVEYEDQGDDIDQGVDVEHEPDILGNDNDEDTELEDDTDVQNNQDGNNNISEIQGMSFCYVDMHSVSW